MAMRMRGMAAVCLGLVAAITAAACKKKEARPAPTAPEAPKPAPERGAVEGTQEKAKEELERADDIPAAPAAELTPIANEAPPAGSTPGAVLAARHVLIGELADSADPAANRAKFEHSCHWREAGEYQEAVCDSAPDLATTPKLSASVLDAYQRVVMFGEQPKDGDFVPVVGDCGFLFRDVAQEVVFVQCGGHPSGPMTLDGIKAVSLRWAEQLKQEHDMVMDIVKKMPTGDFSVEYDVYDARGNFLGRQRR